MSGKVRLLRAVGPEVVQRYYLQSEMLKLAKKLGWDAGDGSVDQLPTGDLWPLGMALSWVNLGYTGEYLGRTDFEWFEAVCPVDAITFVDVDQSANTTQRSVQRNLSPSEFAAEIERWRNEHESEEQPLQLKHAILRQRGDEILLLDGTHRFMRQVAEGASEVACYVGRPVHGKKKQLSVTGPEIRRLRDLWRTADSEEVREAILTMTKHLMRIGRHGDWYVEAYWIMYGREPETRAAGRRLLGRDPGEPDRRYNPTTGKFE